MAEIIKRMKRLALSCFTKYYTVYEITWESK